MKRVTLITIMSLCLIIATYFAEIIIGFFNLDNMIYLYRFFSILNLLGYIGLLPFFIKLYQKQ
jgi:hypothetical protein